MGSILRMRRSRHVMSALVCGLDVHKDSTYLPPAPAKMRSARRLASSRSFGFWDVHTGDVDQLKALSLGK
jgi:hypothetical protein